MKLRKRQLTFIDLFAGCGGLSLGLEKAGFYPLYVNELNKDALETYLVNRDADYPHLREKYNSRDIKSIINEQGFFAKLLDDLSQDFGRDFRTNPVDLIAGGPPCQGFSGIGIRRSYSVDKEQLPSNHLFQDMAHFVHMIKPKMFLFENKSTRPSAVMKALRLCDKEEVFELVIEKFRIVRTENGIA